MVYLMLSFKIMFIKPLCSALATATAEQSHRESGQPQSPRGMPAPAGEGLTRRAGCQTLSSPRIHPVLPEGLDVPVHLRVDRTPLSSSPHQHTGAQELEAAFQGKLCVQRG